MTIKWYKPQNWKFYPFSQEKKIGLQHFYGVSNLNSNFMQLVLWLLCGRGRTDGRTNPGKNDRDRKTKRNGGRLQFVELFLWLCHSAPLCRGRCRRTESSMYVYSCCCSLCVCMECTCTCVIALLLRKGGGGAVVWWGG